MASPRLDPAACLAGPLALAALMAVAAACGSEGAPRLQGTWRGQRAEGVPASAAGVANAFAAGMLLEVKGDGIAVTTARDRQSGRYKVVKEDKTSLVITTDKDGAGARQTFTFVDDRTMKWAVLDGNVIVFAKQ